MNKNIIAFEHLLQSNNKKAIFYTTHPLRTNTQFRAFLISKDLQYVEDKNSSNETTFNITSKEVLVTVKKPTLDELKGMPS